MAEEPKRPLSSYFIFMKSSRESIMKENPHLRPQEIAKKGGELWRNLKDKTEWIKKAATLKAKYELDMEEFERKGGKKNVATKKKRGQEPAKKLPAKKTKKAVVSQEKLSDQEESD